MFVALWVLRSISSRRKIQLLLLTFLNLGLSLVELVGVSLLALGIVNGSINPTSSFSQLISSIAPVIVLDNLLLSGCLLLLFRSIGTAIISAITFSALSKVQGSVASKLAFNFLSQKSSSTDSTSFSYAVNDGVNAATIGFLGLTSALFNEIIYISMLCIGFFFVGGSFLTLSTIILMFSFGILTVYFGKLIAKSSKEFAESTVEARQKSSDLFDLSPQILFTQNLHFAIDQFLSKRVYAGKKFSHAQSLMQLSKSTLEVSFLALILMLFAFVGFDSTTSVSTTLNLGTLMIFGIRLLPALLKAQSATMSLRSIIPVANTLIPYVTHNYSRKIPLKNLPTPSPDDFRTLTASGLGFKFENEENYLFDSVDFEISETDFLLICGKSGKGKSTLAKILAGLDTPSSGFADVNGVRVEIWRSNNLNSIAFCPQSPYILNATTRENILLERSSEPFIEDELKEIIRICALNKFVEESSLGLETLLMGEGIQPSGGEMQRIGLARALALRPSLLILDEPTSALDMETELEILSNLSGLPKAIIMVSHSDQAKKFATKILNLD